jgi:Glycosyltransferase sugar-binding region containing DXD motif
MIPNRIHFIFGLDPLFGGKPFSFIHYLAIRSAAVVNQPDEMILHYAYEPDGIWWEAAKPLLTLNRVTPSDEIFKRRIMHFAHKADVLRLELLRIEGGIYLDMDIFCIRSFEPLRNYHLVMGVEPNAGLCNAVILAEPNSEFLETWLTAYRTFDETRWNYHSVQLPYQLSMIHSDLIHVEDEYSFFFPSYDDPMHLWLWQRDLGLRYRIQGAGRVVSDIGYYLGSNGPVRVGTYRVRS